MRSRLKTQWRGWGDDIDDLVVLDPFEHSALVRVRIIHDLADVAHRDARDAVPFDDLGHLHLAEGLCPCTDEGVGLVDMRDAVGGKARSRSCFKLRVIARLFELGIAIGKVVRLPGGALGARVLRAAVRS